MLYWAARQGSIITLYIGRFFCFFVFEKRMSGVSHEVCEGAEGAQGPPCGK